MCVNSRGSGVILSYADLPERTESASRGCGVTPATLRMGRSGYCDESGGRLYGLGGGSHQ